MKKDKNYPHGDDDGEKSTVSPLSITVLFLLFVGALLLLVLCEKFVKAPVWKGVFEHLASGLIAATSIGICYESLVHRHRDRTLKKLLNDHQEKMYEALKVYMLTTPGEVLNLIEEIAQQTNQIPTLYFHTREKEKGNEYTFARRIALFDTLIANRRKEVIAVMRTWIKPDKSINLRFLAGDVIGKHQLKELKEELRMEALKGIRGLSQWGKLPREEKFCTLNYLWAASRCEKPKYELLRTLLVETDDLDVQEWILFVPQQMPEDQEFVEILRSYLRVQSNRMIQASQKPQQASNLVLAAVALAALERERPGGARGVFVEFSKLFLSVSNTEEIREAWRNIGIPPEFNPRTPEPIKPRAQSEG